MLRTKRVCRCAVFALIVVLALAVLTSLVGCEQKKPVTVAPGSGYVETEVDIPIDPIIWPYTGLRAPDEKIIWQRPLSVKIENSAAARPQRGLNRADVVYETIAEGGITRFNAIYHSDIPELVVPVRSARLSDSWIVPQYNNALFFFSGGNEQVQGKIKSLDIANMSHDKMGDTIYGRQRGRSAPHNLYLELSKAYEAAASKGFETVVTEAPVGLEFKWLMRENDSYESIETTVTSVTVPFSDPFKMTWDWDATREVWLRSTNGKEQTDEETGERIFATNVVVMWAEYIPSSIRGTYDVVLGGQGKAAIFMGGKRIDCTWEATQNTPPVFRDGAGNPIRLNPGRTWFEVPPTDIGITVVTPPEPEPAAPIGE